MKSIVRFLDEARLMAEREQMAALDEQEVIMDQLEAETDEEKKKELDKQYTEILAKVSDLRESIFELYQLSKQYK